MRQLSLLTFVLCLTVRADNSSLLYIQGRQHLLSGNYEAAAPLLEKALASDPTNALLLNQLAETFLRIGNFEKAEIYAKQALDRDPSNTEVMANYGGILNTLKRYDEAKTLFKRIIELDPNNNKAPLLLGIIEAESGDLDTGIATLSKAVESNPENVMAFFYRAKLLVEANRLKDAAKDLERCMSIRPSFLEAGTTLGVLYERAGDNDSAIATYERIQGVGAFKKRLAQLYLEKGLFEKALSELSDYEQFEPDDYTARVKSGLLLVELKRFEEAKGRFQKILSEQPQADNVRFYLAAVIEELKDYPAALVEFKKISRHSSFFKEAALHVGFILKETHKIKDGLAYAKKTLKENPEVIEFYDMEASFYEASKDMKQAMKSIDTGLKRFPKDEKLLYFEAALLDKMNQRDKALAKMKNLLEINSSNPHALNFIGYTYAEMNQNLEEAKTLVQKAITIRPNDGFILDSLGWICFKLNQFDEASTHLEKALALQPNEPVILEHLGDLSVQKKELAKASEYYKRAVAEYSAKKDAGTSKKIESKLALIEKEKRSPTANQ